MTQEIGRRLIDGVWVTDVQAEGGGGGGSLPDPFVVTGTDPDQDTVQIVGAPNQQAPIFEILTEAEGSQAVTVETDLAGGLGNISLNATDGAAIGLSDGYVAINGPVAVILKPPLSEPSDALLNQFGQVIVWVTNTAGSAKLNFKTLNSDEAVVKGSINLVP